MEELKPLEEIIKQDLRSTVWAIADEKNNIARSMTLQDHYKRVEIYRLRESVPDKVRSHFATALNLFLYTWFCYDFFPVAEQRVLTTLEFALREKIGPEDVARLEKKRQRGLKAYIQYAINKGWIINEDFRAFHRIPYERARHEYRMEKVHEMQMKGLDSIDLNYEEVEVPEENDVDYLGILLETVNKIRNDYAHGTNMLHPTIGYSFEMVTDFINALFPSASEA